MPDFSFWPHTDRVAAVMADSSLVAEITEPKGSRTAGNHVSELLRMLHPVENGLDREDLNRMATFGLAWEDRVQRAMIYLSTLDDFPFYCVNAPELEYEGEYMTPDLLLISKEDGSMREMSIKLTWRSTKDAPTGKKFAYYVDQCMTYATPLKTTSSVLFVGFINGDYAHQQKKNKGKGLPPVPQIMGWDVTFTEREKWETWETLKAYRREQ